MKNLYENFTLKLLLSRLDIQINFSKSRSRSPNLNQPISFINYKNCQKYFKNVNLITINAYKLYEPERI